MEGGRAKRQKIDKTNKFAAFQKLKDLKGQGVKHKYEFTADENVYEEVSEKEYTERVLKRQEDDWIDDDGGDGYVEDGREIFDDDIEDVPQKKEKHDKRKKNKNIQNPNAKGKACLHIEDKIQIDFNIGYTIGPLKLWKDEKK